VEGQVVDDRPAGRMTATEDATYSRAVETTEPLVSVAVVSFNTRELLVRCVRSLAASEREGLVEVVVVDNASSDGSAEAARDEGPWVKVIDAVQNLGFGRAVNLAASAATAPWLLIANADVAFEPDAVRALMAAGQDTRVGAVVPRLVLPDGSTQHSVHPFPTVPLTLAFNLGLHRLSGSLSDRLCLEGHWDPDRARPVPWALGAAALVRREAFDEVGGFDPDQWMYAEDLDLFWRLAQRGWITRYEPAARVAHESGASTAEAFGDERTGRFLAATYELLRRRRGSARMWLTGAINVLGAAARVAWMAPAALLVPRLRAPSAENLRWLRAHIDGLRLQSHSR